MTSLPLLYGDVLRTLADIPPNAQQCSPLVPGSMVLTECRDACAAIVLAPPSTLERRYVLAQVLSVLAPDAPLTSLALKDKGGSRIAVELEMFGCKVVETSRSHHRIVTTTRPAELQHIAEALAAGGMQRHAAHGLWTQPGVFSWDRIDAGSALLLEHLPALTGEGADFGCGIGVLARAVLASPGVTRLTLADVDRRAVACAERNITDARAQFQWADVRSLGMHALDFVVMNPPFHNTGIEDKALGQAFIAAAAAALKPGGKCWLVANRHLPYEALLAERFSNVGLVTEADGFKLIQAER